MDAIFTGCKSVLNAILIIDVQRDLACNGRTELKITQTIQDDRRKRLHET